MPQPQRGLNRNRESAGLRVPQSKRSGVIVMTYRVYSGPPGTEAISPMEKDRWLYKEFGLFDDALSWARHVNEGGRITLLIEGDDGTRLTKTEIAAALKHPEAAERQLHARRSGREH
jgi:hypothetical protein